MNKKSIRSRAIRKHIIDRLEENQIYISTITGDKKRLRQLKLKFLIKVYENTFNVSAINYISSNNIVDEVFNSNILEEIYEQHKKNKLISQNQKVYLIGNIDNGICKIGISKNPYARITEVQTGCPYKLELLGLFPGGRKVEQALHKKYKDYRLNGEWFEIKGELKDSIESIKDNPHNIL